MEKESLKVDLRVDVNVHPKNTFITVNVNEIVIIVSTDKKDILEQIAMLKAAVSEVSDNLEQTIKEAFMNESQTVN